MTKSGAIGGNPHGLASVRFVFYSPKFLVQTAILFPHADSGDLAEIRLRCAPLANPKPPKIGVGSTIAPINLPLSP